MLCITMRKGDYVILGDSIVIQVEQISNERAHLNINAPPGGCCPPGRGVGARRRQASRLRETMIPVSSG